MAAQQVTAKVGLVRAAEHVAKQAVGVLLVSTVVAMAACFLRLVVATSAGGHRDAC